MSLPPEDQMRLRLAAFASEQGMRKCAAPSWEQRCEERATKAYKAAVAATGGVRAAARRSERDPKTIRDRREAARGLYFVEVLKLGKSGILAAATEMVAFADTLPDDAPESRNGTDG